jgi:hypothetical protein
VSVLDVCDAPLDLVLAVQADGEDAGRSVTVHVGEYSDFEASLAMMWKGIEGEAAEVGARLTAAEALAISGTLRRFALRTLRRHDKRRTK